MSNFVPYYHFDAPSQKLNPEWAMKAINDCYYNNNNVSLLDGKDQAEVEAFSIGRFPMWKFKRMFKSLRKKIMDAKSFDGTIDQSLNNISDNTGIDWQPLPLIPQKLNSASATIIKVPIEVSCQAQDALAMKKRDDDITFLKNKSRIEEDLQPVADMLGVGKVDIGDTKHSGRKFSDTPMGLDLNKPDEEDMFRKLIYSLRVETANEKVLQQLYDILHGDDVRLLDTMDQLKWGVSCIHAPISAITGLPQVEYIYPGDIRAPKSLLPDYGDNTHRIWDKECTVLELFNMFGNEIGSKEDLEKLINGRNDDDQKSGGYCQCNNLNSVDAKNFGEFRVQIKYIEVKSVDWIGVAERKTSGFKYFTDNEAEAKEKIWAQNTYGFFWLLGTKRIFGIKRLPFAHRERGQESYQNFSTIIYRSQKISAVELSIGENKKAQIADIKLQHALIKSLPSGRYFDLKYMRGAVESLKEKANEYTIDTVIQMLLEHNTFIADTSGFDGKVDGQQKPVIDLPGGLKTEIGGYIQTIINADQNISNFTGINPQLTGQSANPEGLVGLQKLLINSSINAIHYCSISTKAQFKTLFNIWASQVKQCIEMGGKVKQGIINFIGIDDTSILDGLDETPLHNLTIKVEVDQREEERQEYRDQLNVLKKQGVISTAEQYILSSVKNIKERMGLLAVIEKKWQEKQDQIREEQFANQQRLLQQQGQNMVQATEAEVQGDERIVYAKGDVQAKLLSLGNQLNLSQKQLDALIKKSLQNDRNEAQTRKGIRMLQAKKEAESQQPLI